MFSVHIQGQEYRVTNETLDRLFGMRDWREMNPWSFQNRVRAEHRAGRLIVEGKRLRLASPVEEAENRLRWADARDEILRSGFLCLAAQLAVLAGEVRGLRESVEFDTSAATTRLSRADGENARWETTAREP
jgi:hypothetical protein